MDRERIIRELGRCRLQPDGHKQRYTIVGKLGQGGNGVAFVVRVGRRDLVAKVYVPPDSRDLDAAAFKRFSREIELSTRTKHPFVVPVAGTGSIAVGAYTFPFYLMPRAKGTLRQLIPPGFTLNGLGDRLRVFTQVLAGVSYLHHLGIFHRDLKPENVLLSQAGVPMVADLGIAHVAPGFVEWSKLTLPKDHLMNWDYYAPEQRGSDATKVDHRADIYALGLILYELVCSVSPSRPNVPQLASFDDRIAKLDDIFRKMTAHDPAQRYQNLDIVQDELFWTLIALGIPAGAPSTEEADKKILSRLLQSANAAHRARAHEIVARLGDRALPELHEMTGHRRLDVALSAYQLLGALAHKESIPYLVAGLYPRRSSQKPRFLTGEAAADALQCYSPEDRLIALKAIKDLVLVSHIDRIVDGIPVEDAYPAVLRLYQQKLLSDNWGHESGIAFLLGLNQDRTWQIVEQKLSGQTPIYSFTVLGDFFPYVNPKRQMVLINFLLKRDSDLSSWALPQVLNAVVGNDFPGEFVTEAINRLKDIAQRQIKRWKERQDFIARLQQAETKVLEAFGDAAKKKAELDGKTPSR